MKKFFNSIVLLIFLSSCVSTKVINLSPDEANNFRGKTIAVVPRDKSTMTLKTPFHTAMLGGALVAFHMIYKGNQIVKENGVEDPSILLAQKLQGDLAKDYNLKIVTNSDAKKADTYDVNKISDLYRGIADYALDARTLSWELSYVGGDISNYVIVYSSQLKLIDVKNAKVVGENSCKYTPYNKYRKDAMLADGAKILKQELSEAANACSNLFKDLIFSAKK